MAHRHPIQVIQELRLWTKQLDALEKKAEKLPTEGELTDDQKELAADLEAAAKKLLALGTEWQKTLAAFMGSVR